jgi:hypothetical protein
MLTSCAVNGVANADRGNIDITYTLVANSLEPPCADRRDDEPQVVLTPPREERRKKQGPTHAA